VAYRKPMIAPPWGGWNDSGPSLALPPNSFRQVTNWLINKQRLTPFLKLALGPQLPTGSDLWGARTFQDLNANFHTVLFGDDRAWYLKNDGTLVQIGAPWQQFKQPYAIETFQNQIFFCNGSNDPLRYIKGDANWYVAGDVQGSSFFLGKLAQRLFMINTVENSFQFVNRVRWSAIGNPLEWVSAVDYTAGAVDIDECEDQLSGWATLNNTGFAYRNSGISTFSPTGIGAAPFFIENFSEGPSGVGVFYPYTLSQYGQICGFASLDEIYVMMGSSPQPIGKNAKKAIFKDIFNANSFIATKMLGTLGSGIDYLSYWLACPQKGTGVGGLPPHTSLWIYHFDDQSWVNVQLPGPLRTIADVALT
jgi:hypothetical protein